MGFAEDSQITIRRNKRDRPRMRSFLSRTDAGKKQLIERKNLQQLSLDEQQKLRGKIVRYEKMRRKVLAKQLLISVVVLVVFSLLIFGLIELLREAPADVFRPQKTNF